jgi:hypothetical protein
MPGISAPGASAGVVAAAVVDVSAEVVVVSEDSLPPPHEAKNKTVAIAGTNNNLFMFFSF